MPTIDPPDFSFSIGVHFVPPASCQDVISDEVIQEIDRVVRVVDIQRDWEILMGRRRELTDLLPLGPVNPFYPHWEDRQMPAYMQVRIPSASIPFSSSVVPI